MGGKKRKKKEEGKEGRKKEERGEGGRKKGEMKSLILLFISQTPALKD